MDPKDPNYVPPIDQADRRAQHRRRLAEHGEPPDPPYPDSLYVQVDEDKDVGPEEEIIEDGTGRIVGRVETTLRHAVTGEPLLEQSDGPEYRLRRQPTPPMDEPEDYRPERMGVPEPEPEFESSHHPLRSAEVERLFDDQPLLSLFERLLLAELRMARQQLDRLADALEEGVAHR